MRIARNIYAHSIIKVGKTSLHANARYAAKIGFALKGSNGVESNEIAT